MTTKKNLVIPIFDYKLTIIIFDDWNELTPYIGEELAREPGKGISIDSTKGSGLMAICSSSPSTITHESVHITNYVWKHIGYMPQRDNDEVTAYLATYIYRKAMDVYIKHEKEA